MPSSGPFPQRAASTSTGPPDVAGPPLDEVAVALGATATVRALDGSVIAAVSRHLRPAGPDDPGPEVIVHLRGELDLDTAPLAEARLIQALNDAPRVCLDLGEVWFFGAAGARIVVIGRLHAAELGRTLRLSGVHGIVERVLRLSGLYPFD